MRLSKNKINVTKISGQREYTTNVCLAQACKSTVLIFTLAFAVMFKLQKATWQLALVIVLICSGVVLFLAGGDRDPIDDLGFFLTMMASVMGGFRWVLAQILIEKGGKRFINNQTGANLQCALLNARDICFIAKQRYCSNDPPPIQFKMHASHCMLI